jgi:hypothetical protein
MFETQNTGIRLISRTWIGPGVEMAAGTGLHGITSYLHVPEQGFAEFDGRLFVFNERGKMT